MINHDWNNNNSNSSNTTNNNNSVRIENKSGLIIMQNHKYACFTIVKYFVKWECIRLIWIGFYKNSLNNNCYIDTLGKDVVRYILKFLTNIIVDGKYNEIIVCNNESNDSNCITL